MGDVQQVMVSSCGKPRGEAPLQGLLDLHQFSSVAQSCLILREPMDHNTPGLRAHHQLLEFSQTHVH